MRGAFIAVAAAVVSAHALREQDVFWWHYPLTDAAKLDISQLPCGSSCTLAQLESACISTAGCVAFNTDGWLKNSVSDMAASTCDLYVKKSSPQPSPTPPPPISFWPVPINVSYGPGNLTGMRGPVSLTHSINRHPGRCSVARIVLFGDPCRRIRRCSRLCQAHQRCCLHELGRVAAARRVPCNCQRQHREPERPSAAGR